MLGLFKKTAPVSAFDRLSDTWSGRHVSLQEKLWRKHGAALNKFLEKPKQWTMGTLAGIVLLGSSGLTTPDIVTAPATAQVKQPFVDIDKSVFFKTDLLKMMPEEVRPLTDTENQSVAALLSKQFHMNVSAELQGKRLNRTYGLIGAEQHLARFPGDTMATHFANSEDSEKYYSSGMAPGLGGWGYFGSDVQGTEREKYYIAVQSFLSPGYEKDPMSFNKFYRFRKMLVVNPENGKALVAVIGDAGPSPWTGKHLGGSPEVMSYLERVDGAQKGPVLYFFIDDPQDSIPLGPIDYN